MGKLHITATLLAIVSGTSLQAQVQPVPRLVVGITIDQLRSDYLELFEPLYSDGGLKRMISGGRLYTSSQYTFSPIDRASSMASQATGAPPHYNGIVAGRWLDRTTLQPTSCVSDNAEKGIFSSQGASPQNILTTTLSDELKIFTDNRAYIYSIAKDADAAIIPAGHNADGAFWIDTRSNRWCTSTYYPKSAHSLLEAYNKYTTPGTASTTNDRITQLALRCLSASSLGKDETTDMLFVTYQADAGNDTQYGSESARDSYLDIDRNVSRLLSTISSQIGADNVLVVLTGTSVEQTRAQLAERFRIPSGTFYINRTANLLNMYLGALYGSDRYVEAYHNNHIYLNNKLIDQKRLDLEKVTSQAAAFIRESQGVSNAYTGTALMSEYSPETDKLRLGYFFPRCGDIIIEVAPGWNIQDEDTHQQFYTPSNIPTPIIFYGAGVKPQKIAQPVEAERIPATVAKAICIRAPNACKATPLF